MYYRQRLVLFFVRSAFVVVAGVAVVTAEVIIVFGAVTIAAVDTVDVFVADDVAIVVVATSVGVVAKVIVPSYL